MKTISQFNYVQLVTNCPVGELLKGEVLGSSNAKRINNLPVDMKAFPSMVRGQGRCAQRRPWTEAGEAGASGRY